MAVDVTLVPSLDDDVAVACSCESSLRHQLQSNIPMAIRHKPVPFCPWIHMPNDKHQIQTDGHAVWLCDNRRHVGDVCASGTVSFCGD